MERLANEREEMQSRSKQEQKSLLEKVKGLNEQITRNEERTQSVYEKMQQTEKENAANRAKINTLTQEIRNKE